jgi:hypothetical protein
MKYRQRKGISEESGASVMVQVRQATYTTTTTYHWLYTGH